MDQLPKPTPEKEKLPSPILVYAIDVVRTHESHPPDPDKLLSFGYDTPLPTPQKTTRYVWKGKLHPSKYERPEATEGTTSSNVRQNIKELADNFALLYRDHQSPELEAQGKSSYNITFILPEELSKENDMGTVRETARELTEPEQQAFMKAFQEANRQAAQKEG